MKILPVTSTQALTNATLPYVLEIANKGWQTAVKENLALKKGVNMIKGNIVYDILAKDFDLPYTNIDTFL